MQFFIFILTFVISSSVMADDLKLKLACVCSYYSSYETDQEGTSVIKQDTKSYAIRLDERAQKFLNELYVSKCAKKGLCKVQPMIGVLVAEQVLNSKKADELASNCLYDQEKDPSYFGCAIPVASTTSGLTGAQDICGTVSNQRGAV